MFINFIEQLISFLYTFFIYTYIKKHQNNII